MNATEDQDSTAAIYSSMPFYDDLRSNKTGSMKSIRREKDEKLDWIQTLDGEEIPICHVSSLVTLTAFGFPEIFGYREQAASALAFQHLNAGDGSITPEAEGLNERCPIRFTLEVMDNEYDLRVTAQNAIDSLARPEASLTVRKPCVYLGARASITSIPIATLTGINEYLQVAGTPSATSLDDQSQFPLFARTFPSQNGATDAMVTFLSEELGVSYFAILNTNDEFGNAFVDSIRASANSLGIELEVAQFSYENDDKTSQQIAVRRLKESEYRYIYVASGGYTEALENIIEEAVQIGIAGVNTYAWFFSNAIQDIIQDKPLRRNSPEHLAFRGHGNISPVDFDTINNPGTLEFIRQIRNAQNEDDLGYLNSVFSPIWNAEERDATYLGALSPIQSGEYLEQIATKGETESTTTESFFYDAAMALGLATCDAYAEHGPSFTGAQQYQSLLKQSFRGLSGQVNFLSTGTRDQNTFSYAALTSFEQEYNETYVLIQQKTSRIRIGGEWQFVNDYLFNDGTTNSPSELPPINLNENLILSPVRGTVFGMLVLIILLVASFGYWTLRNISNRVVRASQPFFLFTLMTGVVILAFSIVPLSIDKSVASLDGCIIACNSTIWLVSVGFCVTFSALFTKNYRINTILKNSQKMRRVTVTIQDAIIPMIVLLSGNALVLTLMTILAPIDFTTEEIRYDSFGRVEETFSRCSYDDGRLPYMISLAVINLGCLLFSILQAYEARNLSVEFSESLYIFEALILILLIVLIGVPVMVLARDDSSASTFLACTMIFVMCCSILVVIFVPKINFMVKRKKEGETTRRNQTRLDESGVGMSAFFASFMDSSQKDSNDGHISGLQVYGSETKEQLFAEVQSLVKQVQQLQKENTDLKLGKAESDSSPFHTTSEN